MVETAEMQTSEAIDILRPCPQRFGGPNKQGQKRNLAGLRLPGQITRFGVVGIFNSLVDILLLNGLLWLYPTTNVSRLLAYNLFAYSLGAINSFLLNKYWTFRHTRKATVGELLRFALTTLCGIGWSSLILWLAGSVFHPLGMNMTLWANLSKVVAILGGAFLSYIAMRLWVFVKQPLKDEITSRMSNQEQNGDSSEPPQVPAEGTVRIEHARCPETHLPDQEAERKQSTNPRLSVVLPVCNDEEVITSTKELIKR